MNDFKNRNNRQGRAFLRRFRTQVSIVKDKYLGIKKILQIILPMIVGIVVLLISVYLIVLLSYKGKIIKDPTQISKELNTAVVVLDSSIDADLSEKITSKTLELYKSRFINRIVLVIFTNNLPSTVSTDKYTEIFKDIPKENFSITLKYSDFYTLCNSSISDLGLHKFLLIAPGSSLIKGSFICNSKGIYTQGFLADNKLDGSVDFFDFLPDIFRIVLNPKE